VLFINPDDVGALGFVDGDRVDLISEWGEPDGARAVGQGLSAGALSDAARKRRFLLSGDQSVDPPQSRCSHIEHAGLESFSKAVTIRLERHS
jgi:hypothetical protein